MLGNKSRKIQIRVIVLLPKLKCRPRVANGTEPYCFVHCMQSIESIGNDVENLDAKEQERRGKSKNEATVSTAKCSYLIISATDKYRCDQVQ